MTTLDFYPRGKFWPAYIRISPLYFMKYLQSIFIKKKKEALVYAVQRVGIGVYYSIRYILLSLNPEAKSSSTGSSAQKLWLLT